jgi:parallel beta-helix repeat protein/predicted outer membrane repeat protein
MSKVLRLFIVIAILFINFLTPQNAHAAGLCYVNDDAAGTDDGTSWTDAYTDLQNALADSCTEIWVAAGIYKPHASDRGVSFTLESGTAIYGGFAGTETLLSQRNYVTNVTTLSGDLNGNDNATISPTEPTRSENSYHVVFASSVNNTAILDGFTITSGNANAMVVNGTYGGGILNDASSPNIANLSIINNSAVSGGGVYNNNASNPTFNNIIISGNVTSNDGGGMTSVIDSSPTLTDITFSNNSATNFGGGMANYSSAAPTLTNVTFSTNSTNNSGGAVYNYSSNPTFTNVIFNNNNANSSGGGMYNANSSSPTLTNVTFDTNTAASFGGGIFSTQSTPTLNSITFIGNSAQTGGGMYNSLSNSIVNNSTFSSNSALGNNGGGMYNNTSNPFITNVTFSGNSAVSEGGGMYNTSSSPILKNVILANSTSGKDCYSDGGSLNGSSSNNLIEATGANACGLTNGSNGNIIGSDPNLGSLTGSPAYFPLNAGSPAINAGTNTGCPATSQNGVTRPQDSTCDIGAFETYDYSGLILYVKPVGTGAGNCLDWANACALQTAISLASSGNEIWVMEGTYTPHASDRTVSFVLETGVEIYGGFAGTETLLSERDYINNVTILSGDLDGDDSGFTNNGENAYHVVTGTSAGNSAILDGFTISGGNADGSFPYYSGGGLYNYTASSPTLNNIVITGNTALFGGGMLNDDASNPILNNVTFSNNTASNSGGGIYNNSSSNPTLTNVTFSGNSASSGGGVMNFNSSPIFTNVTFSSNTTGGDGGGVHNYGGTSTPAFTNVTFSGNSATTSGGGMYNSSSSAPILKNVIIANSVSGGDCVNDSSTLNASSSNNLIESGGCGLANGVSGNIIGSDPNLGSLTGSPAYFPLNTGSVAINAGTNIGCPATSQNGVTRPQGTNCDIGSYELLVSGPVGPFPTFVDVPTNAFAWAHIESIYFAGVTGGCSTTPKNYCPTGTVTRAQMAVFLMKGMNGSSYSPPAATGTVFNDVAINSFAAAYIEAFAAEGITGGCGSGNFCPNGLVTRAQMAVFLLKAKHGSGYTPPAATGTMFADVPSNAFAAAWIEQLATEGITGGCGNGNYCPNNSVTRAQMAVFLQKTFNLPLP